MSRGPRRPGSSLAGTGRPLFAGLAGALVTLAVAVAVLIGFSLWIYNGAGPKARSGASTTVILRKGAGVAGIGASRQQAGVVSASQLFLAAAQVTAAARRIRAG